MQDYINQRVRRTKSDQIARLRERINSLSNRDGATRPVLDILKGVLDLLEDEL